MTTREIADERLKEDRRERIRWALAFSEAGLHAPICEIMKTAVACVPEDMSVEDLLNFFLEHGLHGTPVVGAGSRLVGFVSLGDLARERVDHGETEEGALRVGLSDGGSYKLGRGFHLQPSGRTVADIMIRPAICLDESAQLTRAAALMAFEGVCRLPIVDADQQVVGVLSALDVLRWIARRDGYRMPDYTQLARRQARSYRE